MRLMIVHGCLSPTRGDAVRIRSVGSVFRNLLGEDMVEAVITSAREWPRAVFRRGGALPGGEAGIIPGSIRRQVPVHWSRTETMGVAFVNRIVQTLAGYRLGRQWRPDIILGETHLAWWLCSGARRATTASKLIIDLHGAAPEECAYGHGLALQSRRVRRLETMERQIVANADAVICQSPAMISHLSAKHRSALPRAHAFECCVDPSVFEFSATARQEIRAGLGLKPDEYMVCYCGSTSKWQRLDDVFRLFAALQDHRPKDRLLVLTPDSSQTVLQAAGACGVDSRSIIVRSVSHAEVPRWLSAADFGILLRENHVLNQVASPTKLGEYLSCGLPVVCYSVARQWTPHGLDPGCFALLDENDGRLAARQLDGFMDQVGPQQDAYRSRCRQLALGCLSRQAAVVKLSAFLRQVLGVAALPPGPVAG